MALNLQSIYVLASGGSRALEQLDTTTNNIANVKTDGFKKLLIKEMSQRLIDNGSDSNHLFVFPRFESSFVLDQQGPLRETNNPFDLAIDGDGWFKMEVHGEILYTRSGHFFLDPQGQLVDREGNLLLSTEDAPIILDPTQSFSVTQDGVVVQNGEEIARVAIESFEKMEAVGSVYYKPVGEMREPEFRVRQGFLEGSNVNPLEEMTSMITAHRRFEIYNNLIKSLDRLGQKTNEIGKA